MVCGDESRGSEPQSLHYCQGYIHVFHRAGERNRGYALLMMDNKCCTELPLFLFSLHHMMELVHATLVVLIRQPEKGKLQVWTVCWCRQPSTAEESILVLLQMFVCAIFLKIMRVATGSQKQGRNNLEYAESSLLESARS